MGRWQSGRMRVAVDHDLWTRWFESITAYHLLIFLLSQGYNVFQLFRRLWKYLVADANNKFNEKADPKIQLQQAITEAQHIHKSLTEQAAVVISQREVAQTRLKRAEEELEHLDRNARQALVTAEEHERFGNKTKAAEYMAAAETITNRLINVESEVGELRALAAASAQAAEHAHQAVKQSSARLQQKLTEEQKLLSQLEQAKMAEQMNAAMAQLSATVGTDVPTFNEIRDKIETRHAKAKGMTELQGQSVDGRMLEIENAAQGSQTQARMAKLKADLGLANSLNVENEKLATETMKVSTQGTTATG